MKKQFLNLGKALNKAEQRSVSGGGNEEGLEGAACDQSKSCSSDDQCPGSCTCQDYLPDDKRCK